MAAGMSNQRRVAALETRKRNRDHPVRVPLVFARSGETKEEAVARYVDEHGPLDEVEDGEVNAIVIVGVAPKERAVA